MFRGSPSTGFERKIRQFVFPVFPSSTVTPLDATARLRIATRIHFALLRHLGDTVEISDILHREWHTREVLWVCEGSGDEELMSLAKQFRDATAEITKLPTLTAAVSAERPATVAPAPQDVVWARDTSGFGVSRSPDTTNEAAAPLARRKIWRRPMEWLRGKSADR